MDEESLVPDLAHSKVQEQCTTSAMAASDVDASARQMRHTNGTGS